MPTLTNVSLRLPVELVEQISHLAKTTGRSRTFYMQEAIKLRNQGLTLRAIAHEMGVSVASIHNYLK